MKLCEHVTGDSHVYRVRSARVQWDTAFEGEEKKEGKKGRIAQDARIILDHAQSRLVTLS